MARRGTSPTYQRSAVITVSRAEEGKESEVEIALSSEEPVERQGWFGDRWIEILDHSAGAVDLSRAKDGLPLLLNHSTYEQVGRITGLRVDDDRRLRGKLRFSRSTLGQEVQQDVVDGIRIEASIGYQIKQTTETEEEGKIPEVRATRWMPMEGSLVPVPADATVGVDRSAGPTPGPEARMDPKDVTPRTDPPAAALPVPGARLTGPTMEDERRRVTELRALARSHKISEKHVDEWIDKGITVDQAVRQVLTGYEGGVSPLVRTDGPTIPDEEVKHYSITRALQAACDGDWDGAGFELEAHNAIAKKHGQPPHGGKKAAFWLPRNLPVDPQQAAIVRAIMGERGYYQRGAHEVATASKGGELKFTEPGPFIELLRNRLFTRQLGARFLTGLQGDVQFPRQTGAHTLSWVGESPTADQAESNMVFDNLNLAPKLATSTTSYTRKLLAQAVRDIDSLIMDDFVQVFAIGLDQAGISGLGTSNQPRGIINTVGIGSVAGGTNGLSPIYDHAVDLEKEVAVDNADLGSLAYLTNSLVRAKLKKVAQISASTGIPVWYQGEVNGYRAEASQQVPANLTKGTSTTICSAIVFGNWTELLYGQWGELEIVVDPYTQARRGNILTTPYMMADVGLRHPQSMAAMLDALA